VIILKEETQKASKAISNRHYKIDDEDLEAIKTAKYI